MKKIIALALAAVMMLSLAACGGGESAPEAPAEKEYKLGMGVVVSTDWCETNHAQVDATVATVVLEGETIVQCRIDVAQNKMDVTDGAVDTAAAFQTKMELGDAYGMVAYGAAIAEWDAQTKAFEEYVVGMTGAEVEAMETVLNEGGHNVSTDETLLAGCTMDIVEFKEAVVKACNDAKGATFTTADTFTLGVSAISDASGSVAATAEEDGTVKMYSEFGAAVVAADGTILAALNDAIQPNITVSIDGEIVETVFKGTKRELGDDYNMVAFGGAIAEWDAQSEAFSQYTVGKTAAEVEAIETILNETGHNVTTDETLLASCTMDITGMKAVIAQAANYAR